MWEQAPSLHVMNSAISPGTAAVIAKAIAKKPEDRFANCREFAERLSESFQAAKSGGPEFRSDATATTPTVQTGGREKRPESATVSALRRRGLRTALCIAAALAVAGVGATAWVRLHRPGAVLVLPRPTKVNPKDGLTYIRMPPGTFQMGARQAKATARRTRSPSTR